MSKSPNPKAGGQVKTPKKAAIENTEPGSKHPKYDFVIYRDMSTNSMFLTKSTKGSSEMGKWEDGNEYPVINVEISSASHPFFTGKQKLVDTEGRIDKFNKKYGRK